MVADVTHAAGLDVERDCWLYNSIICRPENNVLPTKKVIDWCRPNLINTIRDLNPSTVVLLGTSAIQSFVGWAWKEEGESFAVERWGGWHIPCRDPNAWVCPTWHPAYVQRSERDRDYKLLRSLFTRQFRAALALEGRPWKKPPAEAHKVDVILDPAEAARRIQKAHAEFETVCFDYETTCKKPDGPDADIHTCAVSAGTETFAFPWRGKAVAAMRELLTDPEVGKVAHNAKFEDRWTRAKLGVRVRGWKSCTMLAAHALDARRGATALDFQAFVRLGVPCWDSHVRGYLHSAAGRGGNAPNRIRQAPLRDVLVYNGVDALVEWKLFQTQEEDFDDAIG
jgi:uracil-DNA glycosylase family 4